MKPEPSVYRPMFSRSIATAWRHKELWPFAIIACLAGTGIVVNDVLKQAQVVFAPTVATYQGLFGNAITFALTYLRNLVTAGDNYLIGVGLTVAVILLALGIIIAAAQQLVLVAMHRAVRRKKRLAWHEILRGMHHFHVFRVLGINLVFRIAAVIVLTGSGLLLRNLVLSSSFDTLLAIAFSALTLGVAFALNIIAMFSLIGVAREELPFLAALHEGAQRLLRNPIVAFEMSAMLFAVNLILTIVFVLGLALMAAPSALMFAEAIGNGSLTAMILVATASVVGFVAWTGIVIGFATTFTYAVWTELVEKLDRAPFTPRIHAYSRRLVR